MSEFCLFTRHRPCLCCTCCIEDLNFEENELSLENYFKNWFPWDSTCRHFCLRLSSTFYCLVLCVCCTVFEINKNHPCGQVCYSVLLTWIKSRYTVNSALPEKGLGISNFVQEMLHCLYSTALLWSTAELTPTRKYDMYQYSITPQ